MDRLEPRRLLTAAASLSPAPTLVQSAYTYDLTVSYVPASGDPAIDTTTIGTGDISISGPGGFTQSAPLVASNAPGDGSVTATYRVIGPSGIFNGAGDGTYTVALKAGQVTDVNGTAIAAATLGSFVVNVPSVAPISGSLSGPSGLSIDFAPVAVAAQSDGKVIAVGYETYARRVTRTWARRRWCSRTAMWCDVSTRTGRSIRPSAPAAA